MDLYAFLHPEKPEDIKKEVIISERFKNQDGTVQPFIIKPLTQGKVEQLARECKIKAQHNKNYDAEVELGNKMIIAATVVPDFTARELCDAYGTLDPVEVVKKMLLYGEATALAKAIADLSGVQEQIDLKN